MKGTEDKEKEILELKSKIQEMEALLSQIVLELTKNNISKSLEDSGKLHSKTVNKLNLESKNVDNLFTVCSNLDSRLRYVEDFLRSTYIDF